ncbi:T-lymphocyte activation antigen CD80 isoform X2 [Dasypus novemcinctus]|uniref:T-lymphocyte activation antigen CD80 isoform X2 n=1 Tax=Dasypus novemcinctus TaxID=9361 RepID=UPI00265FF82B|nr:T-lymphocyte activation antigen CD80 isoform X2 [Dasypus novemcinctus]
MGHTLKRATPPPRCPHIKLFQLLVLAGPLYLCSGNIQVTTAVKEKAVLSCDYNISAEKMMNFRIYWQKGDKVVLTVISGKEKVWPEYENRTSIDITNNLSITIRAVRLSDRGTYTCVVQEPVQDYYQRKQLILVTLLVREDFPVPNITDLGTPSPNIKRIICSTSGGFPEPHLSWLENEKELNANNTTVSRDPETELYTISSELHFNETTNHTFVCLIKYGDKEVSQIFHWRIYPSSCPTCDPCGTGTTADNQLAELASRMGPV